MFTLKQVLACFCITASLSFGVNSKAEELTLCWGEWDPADALVELTKEFEEISGHSFSYKFEPWTRYADIMLALLDEGSDICDLVIGDSQWLGSGAENAHYVQLNEFFDRQGISMDDYIPAAVDAYARWPKNSDNYYALPAMADAIGWLYRRDWLERESIQNDFKEQYGREIGEPTTQIELLDLARFFHGREIDGKVISGASLFTEGGAEGITMGATSSMYAFGFKYENEPGSYDMEGAVNSPESIKGLEFYREFYDCCTHPGGSNNYLNETLNAFRSGDVFMAMNFFAFFPGMYADPNVGGDKIDFFVNPPQNATASTLGGMGISVVSYSSKQEAALEYIKWFAQPEVQSKWWKAGGFSTHNSVLNSPTFAASAPFAEDFVEAMGTLKDFWQEPSYPQLLQIMQEHLYNYVVEGQGTAEDALDSIIEAWTAILEEDGIL